MRSPQRFASLFLIAMWALLLGCTSTAQRAESGDYINDKALATHVRAAIFNEPTLTSAAINVDTYKGVVPLSGCVASQPVIKQAVKVTRAVQGVQRVRNDLQIK